MNDYKRILSIQDISCIGQCSLTVGLPILSSFGFETCILPTALLSTHTSGFAGFTFNDLSIECEKIIDHWIKCNIKFDCIYTGYFGNVKHIDYVLKIKNNLLSKNGILIVDPVMGDNGKLYPIFDEEYVKAISYLSKYADIIIPNITEACFLSNIKYDNNVTKDYILSIMSTLSKKYDTDIVLTGVGYNQDKTGVCTMSNKNIEYYEHEKIQKNFHGTGDVFSSAFTGEIMSGKSIIQAAKDAANFTMNSIEETAKDPTHWYGVKFETQLNHLIN